MSVHSPMDELRSDTRAYAEKQHVIGQINYALTQLGPKLEVAQNDRTSEEWKWLYRQLVRPSPTLSFRPSVIR